MRGPSSSHTAASHRIGEIIRQVCHPANGKVLVEFDRKGSLATTYEGQGTSMGLICGLIGISILDPEVVKYKELARKHRLNIEFHITDFETFHPNTYKITIEKSVIEVFKFIAISTGGGMIEINNINGFSVSLKGDYFETLLCFSSVAAVKIQEIFTALGQRFNHSEINLIRNDSSNFLINIKSRETLTEEINEIVKDFEGIIWKCQIDPIMPILAGITDELPFVTIDDMLKLADNKGFDIAELAIMYESSLAGIDSKKVLSLMREIVLKIKSSINDGLKGTDYEDRILGHQSHLILKAERENKIIGSTLNTVIAYVTALMEAKSSMGIIVAAPTAGSAGVLGGAVFGAAEGFTEDNESIVKAFMAAGLIGVFIADKYTFAAEKGGCQVECGAASGMAAAALVQLMGGTARQAVNASSMALQNILGLVCDPVADRVEVPCLGKNILGATNAWSSAVMSIAGFDPVVPLDEVIDAMKSVGESLPCSLRCTGLGGLSTTPTSLRLHEELKKINKRLDNSIKS